MKLLNGNTLYEFTVESGGDTALLSTTAEEFQIEFRYRSFQSRSESPDFEGERSIRFPRNHHRRRRSLADVLQEFDVPETTRSDLTAHLNFHRGKSRGDAEEERGVRRVAALLPTDKSVVEGLERRENVGYVWKR